MRKQDRHAARQDRASSPPEGGLTRTSAMLGSPLYMSPEQVSSSRNVDPRTDIWSLGVVLYELLSGRQPFGAESLGLLMVQILQEAPPPIRRAAPDVPQRLVEVVERCLEKGPDKRFADVAELATALAPFSSRRGRHSVDRISRILHEAGVSPHLTALPPSTEPTPLAEPTMRSGAAVGASTGGSTRSPISRDVERLPEVPVSIAPWRVGLGLAVVGGLALLGARVGGVVGRERSMAGAPLVASAPFATSAATMQSPVTSALVAPSAVATTVAISPSAPVTSPPAAFGA